MATLQPQGSEPSPPTRSGGSSRSHARSGAESQRHPGDRGRGRGAWWWPTGKAFTVPDLAVEPRPQLFRRLLRHPDCGGDLLEPPPSARPREDEAGSGGGSCRSWRCWRCAIRFTSGTSNTWKQRCFLWSSPLARWRHSLRGDGISSGSRRPGDPLPWLHAAAAAEHQRPAGRPASGRWRRSAAWPSCSSSACR